MNYDSSIQSLIASIKEDKSIVEPWRNKAQARLEEVLAFIDRGKKITYREHDGPTCICPEGGTHRKCPVHGEEQ